MVCLAQVMLCTSGLVLNLRDIWSANQNISLFKASERRRNTPLVSSEDI